MSFLADGLVVQLFPKFSDDDITDRLNHRWTFLLLISIGVVIGITEYVGDPIHCWCPAQFTDSHCNYTESYCWIEDTYFIPSDEYIPHDPTERRVKEIKYYRWVPVILLFLALCYKLPNLLWSMLNTNSGINLEKAIVVCGESQLGEEREISIRNVSEIMDRWLQTSKRTTFGLIHRVIQKISACFCFCLGKRTGAYLCGLYLGVKVCYIAVSMGIFFILNKFLAMDYTLYGVEVISHLATHTEMKESPRFPRVTLCDFEIRQMQNLQTYTVQCVLPINLFNEKIFAFLWFWFVLMTCFSTLSYITWTMKIFFPAQRKKYVRKYLSFIDRTLPSDHLQNKFTRDYLAMDGVFFLRMLEYNTSEMVVLDVTRHLWTKFSDQVQT